jgi:hypothetical protein
MGVYENQLKSIGSGSAEWRVEGLDDLESQMLALKSDMEKIALEPGWTGASAEAAKTLFQTLQARYKEKADKLEQVRLAVKEANRLRTEAAAKQHTLPDATVPPEVHAAALLAGGVMVPIPGIGTFAAEVVVQKVNEFLGAQREAAAEAELAKLEANLKPLRTELYQNRISETFSPNWPDPPTDPNWPGPGTSYSGDSNGQGAWTTRGGGHGSNGHLVGVWEQNPDHTNTHPPKNPPKPPVIIGPPYPYVTCGPFPPDWPQTVIEKPPTIGIDGETTTGTTGGGGLGGGSLGGGLGGGLAAGLAGAGALGAGSKLASAGGGAGGLFGAGGILGGGAGGAANGAAGGKPGAGAAGAKSSAMMGGGAGGGGGGEKDKRSSLGLIAPKLEDDEEVGPRSAAAGAGGRE